MEKANISSEESLKLLEAVDKHARGVGVENGLQNDSLIRLIIRETGKSVQFQITAAEGGKVYVVGTLSKVDPTLISLSFVLPCFASDGTGQTPDIGQKLIFAERDRKLEEARETPGTGSTVRGLSATFKESRGWSGSPVS